MRKCSVVGCLRPYFAKGFCRQHYSNFYLYKHPLGRFKGDQEARKRFRQSQGKVMGLATRKFSDCQIEGCKHPHYSRHYCRTHYATFFKRGGYKMKPCAIPGCSYRAKRPHTLCVKHRKRLAKNLPMDLSIKSPGNIGERNHRWNGGTSDYPHHYEMKKNRVIKMKNTKGKCEVCGKQGQHIHHIDGSKDNHVLENLILLCVKCHGIVHNGRKNKTSKFFRLYGMTLKELAEKYGGTTAKYYDWHKKGILKDFLDTKV
jgi:5-methylcytosine-specific restriction endonuclease McrA